MIDESMVPENSMFLLMRVLEDGDLRVIVGRKFDEAMPEDEYLYYMDLLNGLNMILSTAPAMVMHFGTLARNVAEYEEQDGIAFEPDEELLEAIAESKVVPLKDRMN
jgi:hypothetical protein